MKIDKIILQVSPMDTRVLARGEFGDKPPRAVGYGGLWVLDRQFQGDPTGIALILVWDGKIVPEGLLRAHLLTRPNAPGQVGWPSAASPEEVLKQAHGWARDLHAELHVREKEDPEWVKPAT